MSKRKKKEITVKVKNKKDIMTLYLVIKYTLYEECQMLARKMEEGTYKSREPEFDFNIRTIMAANKELRESRDPDLIRKCEEAERRIVNSEMVMVNCPEFWEAYEHVSECYNKCCNPQTKINLIEE